MRVALRGWHLFAAALALSAVLALVLALTLGAFKSPADARADGNQGCTPGQVKNETVSMNLAPEQIVFVSAKPRTTGRAPWLAL